MEKRLLLAFVLSFLVLSVWSRMFQQQQVAKPQPELSQPIEQQKDTAFLPSANQEQNELPSPSALEQTSVLENDTLRLEFSNKGGVLNRIVILPYGEEIPLDGVFSLRAYQNELFSLVKVDNEEIVYSLQKDGLRIIKKFAMTKKDYVVSASISAENASQMSKKIDFDIHSFILDISRLDKKVKTGRDQGLYEYSIFKNDTITRKTGAVKFREGERTEGTGNINWLGFRDKYFCGVVKPLFDITKYDVRPFPEEEKLLISVQPGTKTLLPQDNAEYDAVMFFGPQKREILKASNYDFEKIAVYFKSPFFDGIAKAILGSIVFLHKYLPNWGICIVLFSLIFYFVSYPLVFNSMKSMKTMQKEMQKYQPQINKIKEKNKNNIQKQNEEIAKFYKEHNLAQAQMSGCLKGCLPMFIQMPVIVSLYQVLWRSVYFKGESFLWMQDLSLPDRLIKLPSAIPILGWQYINLLPILGGILMFVQQKVSSKNMPQADPAQAEQQKIMAVFMPVIITFAFYNVASGVCLYFTIYYLLSTFTQWQISKTTNNN